jgi:hypothetical protein
VVLSGMGFFGGSSHSALDAPCPLDLVFRPRTQVRNSCKSAALIDMHLEKTTICESKHGQEL